MNRFLWQGGTLVSKAKVTINGVVYEVEPEEYDGQTPLSPENLMQMQEIIFESIYPVGSIYMSTASTNPATLFGVGTWELWGQGKVPVGVDSEDEDFDTVEQTGGEKTHKLTVNEMPKHNHQRKQEGRALYWDIGSTSMGGVTSGQNVEISWEKATTDTGGDQAHNNLQPYITCYMWKRTT